MTDTATIGAIFERHIEILTRMPARGLLTRRTTARLADGLACTVEEEGRRLTVDLPAKLGGGDTGPGPGMLARGALASCLAIGIARWAARMGVPIDDLEVMVEADFDARGELGAFPGVRPGYSRIRYEVAAASPADPDAIAAIIDRAEQHSPYLDVFGSGVPIAGVRRIGPDGR